MRFKMSLLLDTIQQTHCIEILYNIMQLKMSLLLDTIQQTHCIEMWYNIVQQQGIRKERIAC